MYAIQIKTDAKNQPRLRLIAQVNRSNWRTRSANRPSRFQGGALPVAA